jgi:CheY-like chemotaxis protein
MKRRPTKRHWPGKPDSLGHKSSGGEIAGSLPWRVLVIQGDPRERELLTSYLRAAGYVVESAETGSLALSLVVAQPFDLILLDLRLPDMAGYEVCRLLRQRPQTQSIPVIIVTESEELTLHRQAYAAGAQACIPKPVRGPALVATIEAVLAGARREKTRSAAGNEGAGQPRPMSGVRKFERFPVSMSAIGWTAQFPGEVIEGVVRDISAGGFMAELSVQIEPGSTVALVLETPRGALELKGRVVWTSAAGIPARHGCAFPEAKGPDFASNLYALESRQEHVPGHREPHP